MVSFSKFHHTFQFPYCSRSSRLPCLPCNGHFLCWATTNHSQTSQRMHLASVSCACWPVCSQSQWGNEEKTRVPLTTSGQRIKARPHLFRDFPLTQLCCCHSAIMCNLLCLYYSFTILCEVHSSVFVIGERCQYHPFTCIENPGLSLITNVTLAIRMTASESRYANMQSPGI